MGPEATNAPHPGRAHNNEARDGPLSYLPWPPATRLASIGEVQARPRASTSSTRCLHFEAAGKRERARDEPVALPPTLQSRNHAGNLAGGNSQFAYCAGAYVIMKKAKIKIPGQSWSIKEKLDWVVAVRTDHRLTYATRVIGATMAVYFHNTQSGALYPSREQISEKTGAGARSLCSQRKASGRFGYPTYDDSGRRLQSSQHLPLAQAVAQGRGANGVGKLPQPSPGLTNQFKRLTWVSPEDPRNYPLNLPLVKIPPRPCLCLAMARRRPR